MKVIFTTHTYWPRKDGVQYVTQYLAEGLAKKGHEVVVFTPKNTTDKTIKETHNGVKVIRPHFRQKFSFYFGANTSYKEELLRECEGSECIINCAVQSPFNNFVLPLLSEIKSKKILYLHGVYDFKFPNNMRMKAKIKKLALNLRWFIFYWSNSKHFSNYDAIINITSDKLNSEFFPKFGVNVPTYIINNAVEDFNDIVVSNEQIKNYPFLQNQYFLNVANYNERKNQLVLIKAYAEFYRRTKSNVHLVLVGGKIGNDGARYIEECKKLVEELPCKDQIHICIDIPRDITKTLIKNCFCAVMTSTYEVYPIFLAEALSCARPFISTNVGSVNQIDGGIVVSKPEELIDQMVKMTNDKQYYHILSEAGEAYAKRHFSQDEKIDELEKLIISEQ